MEQGFSDIIGQGMRYTDTARRQAFNDFGQGLGALVQRHKQNAFNAKYQDILDRLGVLGSAPETAEERAQLEARKRNLAVIGDMQGLRSPLQALQYEDSLAAQRAREEYQAEQEEKNRAHQVYNNAMSQRRMILNQATMAAATATTPEARKAIEESKSQADLFLRQAAEAKKLGLSLGLPSEYFADFDDVQPAGTAGTQSAFSDLQGKEHTLAKEFMQTQKGNPNPAELKEFLINQGYTNPTEGAFKKVLEFADGIHATSQRDKEEARAAKEHILGVEAKKDDIAAKRAEREKAQQVEDAIVNTVHSDLSSDNPEHVAYLAGRDKPFEQKLGLSANSLVGLGIEAFKNLMNDPAKKSEFYAALRRQREEHPKKAQSVETAPATTTPPAEEKQKKWRTKP